MDLKNIYLYFFFKLLLYRNFEEKKFLKSWYGTTVPIVFTNPKNLEPYLQAYYVRTLQNTCISLQESPQSISLYIRELTTKVYQFTTIH